MPRRKKKKQDHAFINDALLAIKTVPAEILHAEKVTEKLIGKKLSPAKKQSIKIRSAINNYQTAVTRYRRASTLLKKHYKAILKIVEQYQLNNPQQ